MNNPPVDPYLAAWADLTRRRMWLIGSAVWLLVSLFMWKGAKGSPWPIAPMAMAVVTLGLALRCDRFRCPSCDRLFCRKGLYHNAFTRSCLHCGMKAGTAQSALVGRR